MQMWKCGDWHATQGRQIAGKFTDPVPCNLQPES